MGYSRVIVVPSCVFVVFVHGFINFVIESLGIESEAIIIIREYIWCGREIHVNLLFCRLVYCVCFMSWHKYFNFSQFSFTSLLITN